MESDLTYIIPRAHTNTDTDAFLPLFEAVRRYDHEYLLALLEENRYNVNAQDADGRCALHVLLEDGFMGHLNETDMALCITLLVQHQIHLNHTDRWGNTPLSLSVNNEFPKGTFLLIKAGAQCCVKLATKIAHSMPDVLIEMLDNGISIEEETKGDAFVKLDWRPILQFPQSSEGHLSFKREQKETQFLYNLLDIKSDVRERFLYHPLVRAFLHLKNAQMSKRFLLVYMISFLYPICYGVFIWFLYFEHCEFVDHDNDNDTLPIESYMEVTHCDINLAITVMAAILLGINASWTLIEVYMLLRVDIKYLTSWRTWVIRISIVVMGVTLWPALFYQDGYDITWQYPIASIGIFLAFVLFLIQIGLYQGFSIYLEMLVKILLSVLKIILMFLPLFIGFYMGFNMLFTDMRSIFRFIMMTIDAGSEGYDTMRDDTKGQAMWFQALAYTFCVGFLIIIVIVFMNFLLALSIQDVETLKGQGRLASFSRMIQNHFVMDLIYPSSVLIKKHDLKQGKHYYSYDPKASKQQLPIDIRMQITFLLKERALKKVRMERLQAENKRLENKFDNGSANDVTKILINRIDELQIKMDVLSETVVQGLNKNT